MRFSLVDRVLECSPARIVTVKLVTSAEEYLADHFPTFPVLPGVLMLECLVHAARIMLEPRTPAGTRLVLASVRALKYGRFVTPGSTLRATVELLDSRPDCCFDLRGEAVVLAPDDPANSPVAVAGKLSLRPLRLA